MDAIILFNYLKSAYILIFLFNFINIFDFFRNIYKSILGIYITIVSRVKVLN